MGLGVGIVASMASDCADRKDLVALPAEGLFPRSTTWIGFRRDAVLRRYMTEFLKLFAPHLNDRQLQAVREARSQAAIDKLFEKVDLPLRVGCGDSEEAA